MYNIQIVDLEKKYVLKRYLTKYSLNNIEPLNFKAVEIRNIDKNELSEIEENLIEKKILHKFIDNINNICALIILPNNFFDTKHLYDDSQLFQYIYKAFEDIHNYKDLLVNLKNRAFVDDIPVLMGILNITPDSFSDGGKYFNKEAAVKHALNMIKDGADIIDVGGESTRPNADPVTEDEELNRVIPVIEELRKINKDVIISIDTTKSIVAEESIKAGANIINDISGLQFDERIADIAGKYKVPLILMHTKGTPKTMQQDPYYEDIISEIYDFFVNQIKIANTNGVNNIILDPGIGFGKRIEDNYEIIERLAEFKSLNRPILIGLSRKSFLTKSINFENFNFDTATLTAETLAVNNGAKIIRTHNIKNAIHYKYFFQNLTKAKI